ncbi:hypothetical protein OE88DRAFT_16711 [Heliocybe sulcata]|uniref:Zn(2)-C6 fungal-type domain-containing protein n=1 Tax=Heliocybe sulcata TaxID=5364 RepID=A0A5C3NFC0_9AGAM|nr:hypothetical protein OE88DRAFT_16711 [Heliocybe sulcata]
MTNADNGKVLPEKRKRPGRVPVSCAECRRLKTRCDRKVPCEACVKKGCAAICPEGSLVTGRNNRLILANTEQLHDEIDSLRARLQEAEEESKNLRERLEASHSQSPATNGTSGTSAATPSSSSVSGNTGNNANSPQSQDNGVPQTEDGSLIDAFGTLTLGPRGETKFYGQTARAEFLAHALMQQLPTRVCMARLDQELLDAATATPSRFSGNVAMNGNIKAKLEAALPPLDEAYKLADSFLEAGKYMFFPLPRKQVFGELLPTVYGSNSPTQNAPDSLPLLFIIFAFGVLGGLDDPLFTPKANEYYLLARVALNLKSTLRDSTLLWVQAVIYMVQYVDIMELEGTSMPWLDAGIAVKHAYSIGLNLKSCRWGLDQDTSDKRSRAFWQLFALDTWLSFGFGRPPTISLEFVECDFPPDDSDFACNSDQKPMGYHMWTIQYAVMLRNSIVPAAFGAKLPSYSTILDLDRKVREFPVPGYLRPTCEAFRSTDPMYLFMQRGGVLHKKEATLLYLHRGYFAQALQESPEDPLRHKYGTSVMAAYRSAYRLIIGLRDLFNLYAKPLSRMTIAWSHLFSGAIVMSLLVTKSRSANLVKSAFEQIVTAHGVLTKAAAMNPMLSSMQEFMNKLHNLAHAAANRMYFQRAVIAELDRMAGKTRLVSGDSELVCAVPSYAGGCYAGLQPSQPEPQQHQHHGHQSHQHHGHQPHNHIQQFLQSLDQPQEQPSQPSQPPQSSPDLSAEADLLLNIPQNAHPTLTQDIMNFEGLGESLDFPQELYDQPAAENISPYEGDQWRFIAFGGHDEVNANGNVDSGDGFNMGDFPVDTLTMDSAWQSFVQQLGANDFVF